MHFDPQSFYAMGTTYLPTYLALPCVAYLTLSSLTLPYLTLPYLTLPYLALLIDLHNMLCILHHRRYAQSVMFLHVLRVHKASPKVLFTPHHISWNLERQSSQRNQHPFIQPGTWFLALVLRGACGRAGRGILPRSIRTKDVDFGKHHAE